MAGVLPRMVALYAAARPTPRPCTTPTAAVAEERLRIAREVHDVVAHVLAVLTTFELGGDVFGALRAGASGFLLKDLEPPSS